jgi:hypothetical protein
VVHLTVIRGAFLLCFFFFEKLNSSIRADVHDGVWTMSKSFDDQIMGYVFHVLRIMRTILMN